MGAMAPEAILRRSITVSDVCSRGGSNNNSALSLSLTKALVEANRARFNIKSAGTSGTLIEVTFAPVTARA